MKQLLFSDRGFYKTLLRLGFPMVMQNLIASALNMVDTVMVGELGETELAAVGLANQVFFVMSLMLFGICGGGSVFAAQFWGKKDVGNIRRVLGITVILGAATSFLFMVVSLLFPEEILGIFSKDPQVVRLGADYLKITALSYGMTSVTFAYSFLLRSTEEVKLPMRISIFSLGINTLLNYCLIFGKFGFPTLGVEGAAIATLTARAIEMVVLLVIVYRGTYAAAASIREMTGVSVAFIKRFLHTTFPIVLNETLWAIGFSMYSVVYARMGTEVIAAMNIVMTIERLAMVAFFGMGHATAVMIGNRIGEDDEEQAFQYARRFNLLFPAAGLLMGGVLALAIPIFLRIFDVSSSVYTMAYHVLLIISAAMVVRVFNMNMIIGILRGGGDTKFCLVMDLTGTWMIAIPLAFLGGLVWKWPIEVVYLLITVEELYKLVLNIARFRSKKWIRNLVRSM